MDTIELKFKLDIIFEYIVPLALMVSLLIVAGVIYIKETIKEKRTKRNKKGE